MRFDVPAISGSAMAEVDRIMMQDLGVDTLQLMELAGYGVADAIRRHGGIDLTQGPRIVALAGTGGNGGDAMVAARLLSGWGADATVVLVKSRDDYAASAAHQLAILDRLGIRILEPGDIEALPDPDLIIDGLLGFSLQGDPRAESARLIRLANGHPAPTVAIDVPSGLDATTGHVGDPCIRAVMTITLALPKTGLMAAPNDVTGDLWLADIGVPSGVYRRIGVHVDPILFAMESIIHLSD